MQNQADKFALFAATVAQDHKCGAHVDWATVAVGFGGQVEVSTYSQAIRVMFPDGSCALLTGNPARPVSAYL